VEIAQAETGTARQEHEQEHLFSGAEQPAQSLNGRRLPAAAPPPGAGGELQLRHREHGRLRGRGRAAVAVAEWLRRGPAPLRRRRCRRPREHARAAAAEAHHEHHVPDRHRRRQRLPHRELGLRVGILLCSPLTPTLGLFLFTIHFFFAFVQPFMGEKESF